MPVEVLRRFEELTGCIILEGYGLSEASPVTHANPISGVRKVGSIGIALPDTECRIVDLDLGRRRKTFRRNWRIVDSWSAGDAGLLETAAGDCQYPSRGLAIHRRHRENGRRWLRVHCGSEERHDHFVRLQCLSERDRRGALRTSEGARCGRHWAARSLIEGRLSRPTSSSSQEKASPRKRSFSFQKPGWQPIRSRDP